MKKRTALSVMLLLAVTVSVTWFASVKGSDPDESPAEAADSAAKARVSMETIADVPDSSRPEVLLPETDTSDMITADASGQEVSQESSDPETASSGPETASSLPREVRAYSPVNDRLECRETYTYDEQGNVLTREYFHMDNEQPSSTHIYTYNESGDILTSRYLDHDNDNYTMSEYIYDEQGLLEKVLSYDNDDELTSVKTCTLDAFGNILTAQYCDQDGRQTDKISYEYTYDDMERILTQKSVSRTSSCLITYTYDPDGKIAEEQYDFGSSFVKRFEYSYDESGILTGKKQYTNISDFNGPCELDGVYEYIY